MRVKYDIRFKYGTLAFLLVNCIIREVKFYYRTVNAKGV